MKNADNLTDRYKLSINLIRLIVGAILGCGAFTIFASRGSLKGGLFFFILFILLSLVNAKFNDKNWWIINSIVGIIASMMTIFLTQLLLNESMVSLGIEKILLNMLISISLIFCLLCITANAQISIVIGMLLPMILTTANYFVYMFRGSELMPADFLSLGTALNVVEEYTFKVDNPFLYAWTIAIAFIFGYCGIINCTNKKLLKIRVASGGGILLCVMILAIVTPHFTPLHFLQSGSVDNGYILNFVLQLRETFVKKPDGYNVKNIEEIDSMFSGNNNANEKMEYPDVFIVMDESFADLSVLGSEISTNQPVTPFFDSLQENVIKGYALSSVFGGGTPNSEYELLSGNTMGFLPQGSIVYQQYIHDKTYSMISYMSKLGYYCRATHPYLSDGWERTKVYPDFGFDEISFIEDYPQKELIRDYVSDKEMFEEMLDTYKENKKQSGKRQLTFGVTMQNHGSYDYEGNNFENEIILNGYTKNYSDVEQYLTLIHESDKALEYLIESLSQVDHPVLLLFFGDHLPNLDSDFYQEVHGGDFQTLDEQVLRYKVPFVIWTNYDIDEEFVECTSLNYLSTYLYKAASLPLPEYNLFLEKVEKQIPMINSQGYYSLSKQCFLSISDAEGEEKKLLNLYNQVEYNCMFDLENRNENLFPIKE
ncbi:LTA synthase family protein [Dorea formicigenerans]|uniref:LTA synthase family protein n=1 Tax=Dorea formicigenerans TaxID=39486 RepID=A0A848CQ39_9FIRM|nr:LTA synthase family protein [Dorea formicigenerans]NME58290.1 LTA synthase family protein [Dorea formicigenerans]